MWFGRYVLTAAVTPSKTLSILPPPRFRTSQESRWRQSARSQVCASGVAARFLSSPSRLTGRAQDRSGINSGWEGLSRNPEHRESQAISSTSEQGTLGNKLHPTLDLHLTQPSMSEHLKAWLSLCLSPECEASKVDGVSAS